jgi:hypothetical protein
MELPIRDDLLELIRLLELPICDCVLRVLGVRVLIELPIRVDQFELIRLLELPDRGCVLRVLGVLVLIELPIRVDKPELIRLLELPVCGCVLRVLGVRVLIELLDGLRALELTPDRIVTGRLTDVLLDRLLMLLLPGKRMFKLLEVLPE